jgi:tetratricopeptide (TPR) repeat protein
MDDGARLAAARAVAERVLVMTNAVTNAFWEEVRTLFHSASVGDTAARADVLAGADPLVRAEVESLLAAHDEQTPFLEESVWQLIDAQQGERLAGSLIGPYRIVRQLGRGGMGTVFLATREDEEFEQRVAIKLVRGGEMLVQRFRQERQILASLEHPNIARLLDGGTTPDGLPYVVMEYVDGMPIDAYCRTYALSIPDKLRLFLQLCDAVEHAHRALIIHRDIKPANVLVTADGIAKLLDFGIAKLTSRSGPLDATATRIWTPQYASPEQLLGRVVTTSTDVYSLGVLLFELLAERKPFDADTRLPNSEAPLPSSVAHGAANIRALRGEVDDIVLAALEVDPAQRYGSVEKFAEDVRRYLSGHPIAARRSTFGYRASKFVRRNLLAVAAAVVIVVITAVAFAATLHQKRIAERRFDEVRSLARAVVFELHDAIAPLPGSTPARELLVRRALVYLDRLAAEAEDNTPLRVELAGAYLKIGDVQGLPYQANLGDTAGATASYRKALAIAQTAAAQEGDDPEDPQILTLVADAHDRVGFVEQRALRWKDAIQQHEAARAIREKLPRTIKRDVALAQTWTAIGDCRYVGASVIPKSMILGTAEQAYHTALATLRDAKPPAELRRGVLQEIGRANQRLGGYYSGGGRDLPRALRHHDAALRALGERAALDPSDSVARRNYADQFAMKATAQNRSGDWNGAIESTTHALATFKTLAAGDPDNVEAQHDLAFAYGERGIALMSLKRYDEAKASLREAIAIRERLIVADPENQEDRRDLRRVQGLLFETEQVQRE